MRDLSLMERGKRNDVVAPSRSLSDFPDYFSDVSHRSTSRSRLHVNDSEGVRDHDRAEITANSGENRHG
ncbi:MAG: hypothetical protein P1U84_05080 [Parvibaculaceae bacterium]|nr:hypothetical protein [Parvibaculaceae bacterium]